MSAIENLLMQPVAQAIGWALLQFLWQGALIGVITGAALWALRPSAADVRYVVATIGLCLMLTMPVVSAVQAWRVAEAVAIVPGGNGVTGIATNPVDHTQPSEPEITARSSSSGAPQLESRGPTAAAPSAWMPLLLLAWLSGVGLLTLRLMSGWLWVLRMKSHGTAPVPPVLHEITTRLTRSLHVRRTVRFLESSLVQVPTVIGWLKPVVLIPASALAALTPQQLEAIIAHELAHIRRHDYLVNLLQTLVETLLFYHPAVWWLSRRIRIERENCCDDLAVSLCGDAVTYARALADLEELRGGGGLALAANGGSLLQRVRRLLGAPTHAGRGPGWLAGTAAVFLMAGIAASAVGNAAFGTELTPNQAVAASQSSLSVAQPAAAQAAAPAIAAALPETAATLAHVAEAHARAADMARRAQEAHAAVAEAQVRVAADQVAILAVAETQPAATTIADAQSRAVAEQMAAVAPAIAELPAASVLIAAGQQGNFTWSDGSQKLEVSYKGAIEFTDDDTDVRSLTPGGWLKIREGGLLSRKSVEVRADDSGKLERRYWSGSSERPFEPEGRQWLAEALPRFIRQTGLGAAGRVTRIMRAKGVDGVLAEIALIEGSWAKRIYFAHLLKTEKLEPRATEQILSRAGRDLDSDFELASLLIDAADRLLVTEGTRRAYFDAARSIESDFEMRRVYSSALKRGPVSPELLARLLESSVAIESDFEAASLLLDIASQQTLDAQSRPAFFQALAGVEGDFEHRRVLNLLAGRADVDAPTLKEILDSAVRIDSDFEQAALLHTLVKQHSVEGPNRAAFFRVVDSIDSAFERGRVLQILAKRTDISAETIVGILRATQGINGNFESAQVLMTLAANHPLKGQARELYIDVAERLGEFEQGRALSALVKNERTNK